MWVEEPAVDLPAAMAIISCYKNQPVGPDTLVIGEIGLAGEIRSVSQVEQRVREAEKLGFKKVILPAANLKEIGKTKIELQGIRSIKEAA